MQLADFEMAKHYPLKVDRLVPKNEEIQQELLKLDR